jgi:hypothetical protein
MFQPWVFGQAESRRKASCFQLAASQGKEMGVADELAEEAEVVQ